MQITGETYKIFLDEVTGIFSKEEDEGFQHTLPPKMNVLRLGTDMLVIISPQMSEDWHPYTYTHTLSFI